MSPTVRHALFIGRSLCAAIGNYQHDSIFLLSDRPWARLYVERKGPPLDVGRPSAAILGGLDAMSVKGNILVIEPLLITMVAVLRSRSVVIAT